MELLERLKRVSEWLRNLGFVEMSPRREAPSAAQSLTGMQSKRCSRPVYEANPIVRPRTSVAVTAVADASAGRIRDVQGLESGGDAWSGSLLFLSECNPS